MIPVLTVSQMRHIDQKSIGNDATIGYSYMMRAGRGLFKAVTELVSIPDKGDIAIVCGKGNNGGDGFTLGTQLVEAGYKAMCFILCKRDDLRGSAKIAFDNYAACGGNFLVLDDSADLDMLKKSCCIVDAILGTGIKGAPHGLAAEVIAAINKSELPVVSADTPSGLDNDTGIAYDPCVQATITVAMGFPKIGSLYYPGRKNAGSLRIEDLEYPNDLVYEYAAANYLLSIDELKSLLPPRKPAGSKFDHGVAAMLCGSSGMTGSAALAAESALRTGCGMAHVLSPASCIPVLSVKLTEAVLHGIAETAEHTAALGAFDTVMVQVGRANAACIGPGLSHNPETAQLVRKLVAFVNIPVVLDADGINAYKDHVHELNQHVSTLCITPHKGEWERLFGAMPETPAAIADRLRAVAAEYAMTIVYKGYPTLIAAPGGDVYFSPYGNSGMATAGCGDVLAGIITSLAAQGCSLPHAAALGAFIHGKTGDAAAEKYTEYSMLASDVVHCIPDAMKKLSGN